jgi:hypothetical protein
MQLESKFDFQEKVKLIPLDTVATVDTLLFTKRGIELGIRYFCNGKQESIYVFESELEKLG